MSEPTSSSEPVLRKRHETFDAGTVDELVDWCLRRGLDPARVTVHASVKFDTPETPEEVAARVEYQAKAAARLEAWERETWKRLTQKYGTVPQ